jgi:hypothetical protein
MRKYSSPAEALDDIRTGGANTVVATQARVQECRTALEEGDFVAALTTARSAVERLECLVRAQEQLGSMVERSIIRTRELVPGMKIPEVHGKDAEVERIEPLEEHEDEAVKIWFTHDDQNCAIMPLDAEIAVVAG